MKSANQTRSVLLVVLPYRLGDATTDTSKKAVRSFLAFPYGVLTLASYVRRFAENLNKVAILDLNLPCGEAPDVRLKRKISEMQPDVVGFSMSYDVSYRWLKSLAEVVKTSRQRNLHCRRRPSGHDRLCRNSCRMRATGCRLLFRRRGRPKEFD